MNRHSEEGPHITKKRDSICVSKYLYSCLKIYWTFAKSCFKNRKMLYGSTFIWLLSHSNRKSVAICDGLKSVLKWMQQRVIWWSSWKNQHKSFSKCTIMCFLCETYSLISLSRLFINKYPHINILLFALCLKNTICYEEEESTMKKRD